MQQEQDTINFTFGIISYLRNFFSEESFSTIKDNKLNLKILKETKETKKLISWINEIKNNKDNIYKIIIGIYYKKEINNNRRKNTDNDKNIKIGRNNNSNKKNNKNISITNNKKNNANMISNESVLIETYSFKIGEKIDYKQVCKTLQNMEVLNGNYFMKLKIFTYNKTKITGFREISELWEVENKKELGLKGIKLCYQDKSDNKNSFDNNSEIKDKNNYDNFNTINNNIDLNNISTKTNYTHNTNINSTNNTINNNTNSTNNTITNNNTNINYNTFNTGIDRNIIHCACTINNNEKDMILCKYCLRWNHIVCYGYFSIRDKRIPTNFKCYFCSDEIDTSLRDACIYRRVLWILFNEINENDDNIEEKLKVSLKISKSFAKKIIIKLKKDGIIKHNYLNNCNEIQRDLQVKEKVKEYFNGNKLECCISIDEVSNK